MYIKNTELIIIDSDKHKYQINLYNDNGNIVGSLVYKYIEDVKIKYFHLFDGLDFDFLFPFNDCMYIEIIKVYPQHRNKGYGNTLMQAFMDQMYTHPISPTLFLEACPTEFTQTNNLSLDLLIKFYESFGFSSITRTLRNSLMIQSIPI